MKNKYGKHADVNPGNMLIIDSPKKAFAAQHVKVEAVLGISRKSEDRTYIVSNRYGEVLPQKIICNDIVGVTQDLAAELLRKDLGFGITYGLCPLCWQQKLHPNPALNAKICSSNSEEAICPDCAKQQAEENK